MSFSKPLPEWNNPGSEPLQVKKDEGWGVEEHPPADWFNWQWNWTYQALQELQQYALHSDSLTTLETKDGAQTKSNVAETNAKNYADGKISPLISRLDRLSYDEYALWLELYYKGYISSVDASNAKAMMFDGFVDKDNVIASSDKNIDTVGKYAHVTGASSTTYSGYSSATSGSLVSSSNGYLTAQTFKGIGILSSISIQVSTNATSGANNSRRLYLYEGTPQTGLTEIYANSLGVPLSASSSEYLVSTLTLNLPTPVSLDPNKTYTIALGYTSNSWNVYWMYCNTNYSYGSSYTTQNSFSTVTTLGSTLNFSLGGGATLFPLNTSESIYSETKSLSFTPIKARLYISVKEPTGTTVIPTITSNGTNYESLTLVTSRTDPKFTGYTEKEYEVTFANVGQALKFKADVTATATVTPEIKRYGIILI